MEHKTFQELNLSDDFLFAKVMEDEEILKPVIEKILGIRIQRLTLVQPQKVIEIKPEAKGIRLDIFADDDKNNRYSVEMQKCNEYNLDKRGRYYHSMMDLDLLRRGENYRKLQKNCVIFICLFDPFRQGRHRYTFESRCMEVPELSLTDGLQTVFLSTRGTSADVDEDMMQFLRYIECSTAETAESSESSLVKLLHEKVKHVKSDEMREAEYMKLLERDEMNYERGRDAGREEGIQAFVLDNMEESVPRERTIEKLMKRFALNEEAAAAYYEKYGEASE